MYTYLLINIFSILIPFIFSFHPKIKFYQKFSPLLTSIIIIASLFIAWDIKFTEMGVWGFNSKYLTGVNLYNLPIEEVLFFLCIPFASIFIYESLITFQIPDYLKKSEKNITFTVATFTFLIGIINYDKLYTSITFLLCTGLLVALQYFLKVAYLSRFYFSYTIILIPFFIVNGILTGTGVEEAIVWYNNNENLGFRLLTIPVEDLFYGFSLLLLIVALYESKLKRFN